MIAPVVLFLMSLGGIVCALVLPGATDWLLLAVPAAIASAVLLLRALLRPPLPALPQVIVDGSNVMHWRDNTPRIETRREVLVALERAGFAPGVVFDANAGYKLVGRYMADRALAAALGLPPGRVMIADRGEPADPMILTAATKARARIVSNDRFRDWAGTHAIIRDPAAMIRGGYTDGRLWLEI